MVLTPQQKAEFRRCQTDPHYFINTYVQIEHQKYGVIPFHLHGFQGKLLTQVLQHRFNIVNKSRQCLPAGTLCDTPNGPVAIESFKIGDPIYSHNLITGELEPDSVSDAWCSGDRQCVSVELEDGRSFEVGENHPFLNDKKQWVKAGNLKSGEILTEHGLPYRLIGASQRVKRVVPTIIRKCYDVSVKNNDTFLINGLVVHNTGISTLAAAYCVWVILFFKNKFIMVVSRNDKEAVAFTEKVKLAYDRLPSWMRLGEIKRNEHTLHLKTGSRVEAEASGKNAGRSRSMYMLILDEGAFITNIRSIVKAALPALSRGGGRCWTISTPDGRSNWFAETWRAAQLPEGDPKKSNFRTFFCHWRDVPEYDQAWYDEMRPQFTDKEWAQEYEGDFLGSGDTVAPGEWLRRIEPMLCDPIEHRDDKTGRVNQHGPVWIWKKPKPGHAYIMGVDTARPDGKDFSSFEIFDLTDAEQVAEYQGHMNLKKLAKLATDIATEYNTAYMVIEMNSFGYMTAQEAYYQLYYTNMYCKRKANNPNNPNRRVPGFQTTPKTRPIIVEGYRCLFMPELDYKIYSRRLFDEATAFIWSESGQAQADTNAHDDLVMGSGLAIGNIDQMMFDSPADQIAERILGRVQIDTVAEYEELRDALHGVDDPEMRQEIIEDALDRDSAPLSPDAFMTSSDVNPTVNEFAWLFADKENMGIPVDAFKGNLPKKIRDEDGQSESKNKTFATVERLS